MSTVIQVRPQQFVKTAALEQISQRALRYLKAGYCVHLEGPTGIGKSTLAIHLADCRELPMALVLGGKNMHLWGGTDPQESWLKVACQKGITLVYDEFNRSPPEVNAVLLSALEERRLVLTGEQGPEYVAVHPDFRVILTSNSEEYCGTHSTSNALMDRLVTLALPVPDTLMRQRLLLELVGVSMAAATLVISLVQQFFRQVSPEGSSSLRPYLMIAEVCHHQGIDISVDDAGFRQVCRDILLSRSSYSVADANEVLWALFNQLSRQVLPSRAIPTPLHLERVHAKPGL